MTEEDFILAKLAGDLPPFGGMLDLWEVYTAQSGDVLMLHRSSCKPLAGYFQVGDDYYIVADAPYHLYYKLGKPISADQTSRLKVYVGEFFVRVSQ